MTSKAISSRRSSVSKEEAKALGKALRSITSLLTLSAGLSVLAGLFFIWSMLAYGFSYLWVADVLISFLIAGGLFWCVNLLDHRNKLALQVYAVTLFTGWLYVFILRLATDQQPFRWLDLVSLILPLLFLYGMNRLKKRRILT